MHHQTSPTKYSEEEYLNFAFECVRRYHQGTRPDDAAIDPHKLIDFILEVQNKNEMKSQ